MKQVKQQARLLSLSCLVFLASFSLPALAQDTIDVSSDNRVALGIKTVELKSASSLEHVKATGRIVAPINRKLSVSSPYEGILLEPLVVPGMSVKKGQRLALIYSSDFAALKVERQQALLMVDHNTELAERAVELGEIGLRSVEEVDEANHEARSSKITLSALDKRLNQVRSASGLGRFHIIASANGIVTHLNAQAGDPLAKGAPVATLFSGNSYWANIAVPEDNIDVITIGTVASLNNTDMTGTVIAIDPETDGVSRTVSVTIELPADYNWRLGGLVTASFLTSPPTQSVPVPTRAIVRMSGETFVFQDLESGFKPVPVTILSQTEQTSFVSGEVTEGDHLAVSGLAALKNVAEGG